MTRKNAFKWVQTSPVVSIQHLLRKPPKCWKSTVAVQFYTLNLKCGKQNIFNSTAWLRGINCFHIAKKYSLHHNLAVMKYEWTSSSTCQVKLTIDLECFTRSIQRVVLQYLSPSSSSINRRRNRWQIQTLISTWLSNVGDTSDFVIYFKKKFKIVLWHILI